MKIKFKKLLPDAKTPYKKNNGDFCYDLYAATDAMPVKDDNGNIIPNLYRYDTGISIEMIRGAETIEVVYKNPDGEDVCRQFNFEDSPVLIDLDARPRSSIFKTGLSLCNATGTVDEPYRGSISAFFYHVIPSLPIYKKGDRIIQVKIGFTLPIEWEETTDELSQTDRGAGGFGSTGKN